jgi:hypothetical protein
MRNKGLQKILLKILSLISQMELIPIWRILRGTLPFRTVHLHDEKGHLEGAISELKFQTSLHIQTLNRQNRKSVNRNCLTGRIHFLC